MRLKAISLSLGMLVVCAASAADAQQKTHELKASPTTVHRSFFDASLKPVLTIYSGDIVRLKTTTANPRYFERLCVPHVKIPPKLDASCESPPGACRAAHNLK